MTLIPALRGVGRSWRGPTRRLGFGLSTILGLRRFGFFIPYRYADRTAKGHAVCDYGAVEAVFERASEDFKQVLTEIDGLGESLRCIGQTSEGARSRPRWNQDWFPRLDAAVAYALVRTRRPRRIVEVGSGHSTRFLARAVEDGALATQITAIDPEPRADISRLGVDVRRATLQEAGLEPFSSLAAGDFVVIDSSHVLMPGSDVDLLVNSVLPALPTGVFIHFHDVFLPDDYPADWRWRAYNEQSAIAAILLTGAYSPVFASRYVATRMASRLATSVVGQLPLLEGARDSSLWVSKRSAAFTPP